MFDREITKADGILKRGPVGSSVSLPLTEQLLTFPTRLSGSALILFEQFLCGCN